MPKITHLKIDPERGGKRLRLYKARSLHWVFKYRRRP